MQKFYRFVFIISTFLIIRLTLFSQIDPTFREITRFGQAPIIDIAWNPEGDLLAVVHNDNTVHLYTEDFEELTKQVSPVHWRNTGTQFSNLRKMEHDVSNYTEITEKDLEIEWVRNALKLEESHN